MFTYKSVVAIVIAVSNLAQAASVPQWHPAGPSDIRGPCPVLNSFANHGLLDRDGMRIKLTKFVSAQVSMNVAVDLASTLAFGGPAVRVPTHLDGLAITMGLDDLRKHNGIEHDASLSRKDYVDGQDNYTFNRTMYNEFISFANPSTGHIDAKSLAGIRLLRQKQSKANNPYYTFDPIHATIAHGEAGLILAYFGHQFGDTIPTAYLDALFIEERLPFNEGWVPPTIPVGLAKTTQQIAFIVAEEAKLSL
ncbi:Chloroperoxidase [Fimicolochytrium jonesii]|uniref:Chloroperoxidase n=1 Tax=Fimicolochytrium jonesii TaxID=1396493 RepID=UPI0022FE1A5F|nr:Chloroperoxidase [Fimicolochytrium jonesii]KAI8825140.1 Chloroperoxidase [Fimicolochytrium jonesii]